MRKCFTKHGKDLYNFTVNLVFFESADIFYALIKYPQHEGEAAEICDQNTQVHHSS